MSQLSNLLQRLGAHKNLRGTCYILEGVALILADEGLLTHVIGGVYLPIAEKFGVSWQSVQRNIRTVAYNIWRNPAQRQLLCEISGCSFPEPPRPAELLSILVTYVKEGPQESAPRSNKPIAPKASNR